VRIYFHMSADTEKNFGRGLSHEFIEKVKQANNIVAVAGKYLHTKQKGKTHWACCPFHHEKTASLAINELQQYYHCFGCGVSGDVITLTQQLESLDFYGAVEFLARLSGIPMPTSGGNENYLAAAKKKQRVVQVLSEVCGFYCKNLYQDRNKKYLEYLHKRGISDSLIKTFNIGVCSDWTESVKYLQSKGFFASELIDAGVARQGSHGLYDVMGERITFAVFNMYSDCIGFTGRTLSADKEIAKYKNTAETIVFDKGSIVYGADVLKKSKVTNFIDSLNVVEGNVDVITLVGAGFPNTVACMGTALTVFHAKVFKRFTDKVYICFDGDAAGQKATLRGLEILQSEHLEVRVVSFPDGLDPDDYVKKYGKEGFEGLIDSALPLIDFKLEHLNKTIAIKDNLDKTKYLKAAVEVLKTIANSPELELYIPKVSQVSGISFDAVKNAVIRAAAAKPGGNDALKDEKKPAVKPASGISVSAYSRALNFIIASLMHSMDFADITEFEKSGIQLDNNLYKRLVQKILEYKKSGKVWKVSSVFDEFDEADTAQLESLINFPFENAQSRSGSPSIKEKDINPELALAKYYQDCIQYLIRGKLTLKIAELKEQYNNTDDTKEKMQITVEIQELNRRIKSK